MIENVFHVLDVHGDGFEVRVFDLGQELRFIADFPVEFGVDELVRNQRIQNRSVAVDLGFVPEMLKHEQLALLVRPLRRRLAKETKREQKAGESHTDHRGARPTHPHVKRTLGNANKQSLFVLEG